MSSSLTLSAEFRKIVEARMDQVLKGVEATFNQIIETQKISPAELKEEIDSLQETLTFSSKSGALKYSTPCCSKTSSDLEKSKES